MADYRGDVHLYIETFLRCSPMWPRPIFFLPLRNASSWNVNRLADEKDSQTTTRIPLLPAFFEGNVVYVLLAMY